MRARVGLVHALWTAGRRAEAVQHLQDMLRLNPNDNQGVRYTLAGSYYFSTGTPTWLASSSSTPTKPPPHGSIPRPCSLSDNTATRPKAASYLRMPGNRTSTFRNTCWVRNSRRRGSPVTTVPAERARRSNDVAGFLAAWKSTPGAIDWVRATLKKPKNGPHAKGPLASIKNRINRSLSQEYDVWQSDFRQMPNCIRIAGAKVRPWTILVTSRSNDLVLAHQMSKEPPSAALVWDTLVEAMQKPVAGKPHRPTELQVRTDPCWESLRLDIEEIGIQMALCEGLDYFGLFRLERLVS